MWVLFSFLSCLFVFSPSLFFAAYCFNMINVSTVPAVLTLVWMAQFCLQVWELLQVGIQREFYR